MDSSKRKNDFFTAGDNRDKNTSDLNYYLQKNKVDRKICSKRDYPMKLLSLRKRGMDYILYSTDYMVVIPIIFAYQNSGGFFLKVDKEFIGHPTKYIDDISEKNYHIIVLNEDKTKYSNVFPAESLKQWEYKMCTDPANFNRIQFYESLKDMTFLNPEEDRGLFDKPLWKQLRDLK